MADKEKIKRILRNNIRPGRIVSEAQISEIADKIILNRRLDEPLLENFSQQIIKEANAIRLDAIDMSDVNDELKK
jgi:hypothetical protein